MINRLVTVLIIAPLAVLLIALAVANRTPTAFTVDPFNPGNPALTMELPLFVYLLIALALGAVIGSVATWWKQGRYRKLARKRSEEMRELRTLKPKSTGTALVAGNS